MQVKVFLTDTLAWPVGSMFQKELKYLGRTQDELALRKFLCDNAISSQDVKTAESNGHHHSHWFTVAALCFIFAFHEYFGTLSDFTNAMTPMIDWQEAKIRSLAHWAMVLSSGFSWKPSLLYTPQLPMQVEKFQKTWHIRQPSKQSSHTTVIFFCCDIPLFQSGQDLSPSFLPLFTLGFWWLFQQLRASTLTSSSILLRSICHDSRNLISSARS